MATTKIEITADNQRALAAYDQLVAAQEKQERGAREVASTTQQTARQTAAANEAAAQKGAASYDRIIREIKKQGPEGRAQAAAIEQHLRQTGQAGRRSIETITAELRDIDPKASEVADAVRQNLTSAADQAAVAADRVQFTKLLQSLDRIGPDGQRAAQIIRGELEQAGEVAARSVEEIVEQLAELRPEAGLSADAIKRQMTDAAEASQREFQKLLEKLHKIGPEGRVVAHRLQREMEQAGERSEDSVEGIIERIRDINPAAAKAAKNIHREMSSSARRSGDAFESFGRNASQHLLSVVGGYVGIHEAIQKVIDLNRQVIETNREAFDSLRTTTDADRRLLQVAGPGDDFQNLRGTADRLASDYGIDRIATRDLVFSARSEGFEQALNFIARNAQAIAPESQTQVAGQIPKLFAAAGETLTPQQAINATVAGAADSRFIFEDLANVLPRAAEGTALAGATTSETLAAISVLGDRFSSAETAAARLRAFGTKVGIDQGGEGRESLQGLGLIAAAERLQSFTPEQRRDFLKDNAEVNTAYQFLIEELDRIKARQATIDAAIASTGTDQSPAALKVAQAQRDPKLSAQLAADRAANRREIAEENRRAVSEGRRQANFDNAVRSAEETGVGEFAIAAGKQLSEYAEHLGSRDRAGIFGLVAGNDLDNLVRDLGIATEGTGNPTANAALLAVTKLRQRRLNDSPDAILGRDAVAEFIAGTTGQTTAPATITDGQRKSLTEAIDSASAKTLGIGRTIGAGALRMFGATRELEIQGIQTAARIRQDFLSDGLSGRTSPVESPDADVREMMQEQSALLRDAVRGISEFVDAGRKIAEATQHAAAAADRTADNTQPRDRDPRRRHPSQKRARDPQPIWFKLKTKRIEVFQNQF